MQIEGDPEQLLHGVCIASIYLMLSKVLLLYRLSNMSFRMDSIQDKIHRCIESSVNDSIPNILYKLSYRIDIQPHYEIVQRYIQPGYTFTFNCQARIVENSIENNSLFQYNLHNRDDTIGILFRFKIDQEGKFDQQRGL